MQLKTCPVQAVMAVNSYYKPAGDVVRKL